MVQLEACRLRGDNVYHDVFSVQPPLSDSIWPWFYDLVVGKETKYALTPKYATQTVGVPYLYDASLHYVLHCRCINCQSIAKRTCERQTRQLQDWLLIYNEFFFFSEHIYFTTVSSRHSLASFDSLTAQLPTWLTTFICAAKFVCQPLCIMIVWPSINKSIYNLVFIYNYDFMEEMSLKNLYWF